MNARQTVKSTSLKLRRFKSALNASLSGVVAGISSSDPHRHRRARCGANRETWPREAAGALDERETAPRILDERLDLQPIAHEPGVSAVARSMRHGA
jgi:hypothetical protein